MRWGFILEVIDRSPWQAIRQAPFIIWVFILTVLMTLSRCQCSESDTKTVYVSYHESKEHRLAKDGVVLELKILKLHESSYAEGNVKSVFDMPSIGGNYFAGCLPWKFPNSRGRAPASQNTDVNRVKHKSCQRYTLQLDFYFNSVELVHACVTCLAS